MRSYASAYKLSSYTSAYKLNEVLIYLIRSLYNRIALCYPGSWPGYVSLQYYEMSCNIMPI